MKILIVDDEADIRDIIAFTLGSEIEAEYVFAETGIEAINVLEHEIIDLVISDFNMPMGTGADVYKFILDKNIQTSFSLCSSIMASDHKLFSEGEQFLGQITKPHVFEGIIKILNLYENRKSNQNVQNEDIIKNTSKYSPISFNILRKIKISPVDIYLKINDNKFIKLFNIDSEITINDIEKYEKKKITSFFILKNDVESFVGNILTHGFSLLENKENKYDEEVVLDAHEVIADVLEGFGISKRLIELTDESIKFTIDRFEKNKQTREELHKVLGYKSLYLTKHSVLLAYINCGLLSALPWDSLETKNKMVMSSFFHDVRIKHPGFDESTYIPMNEGLINFKDHPYEAAKLIRSFDGVFIDVDKIIIEHHEKPDGSGLPRGLSASQLSPLSSLFIFSHDIVDAIFKLQRENKELTKQNILVELSEDYYTCGHFSKCYEAFISMELFDEN